MMNLEIRRQHIRTIIAYLENAKKEKGNRREILVRTSILLFDCYIVDVYFSICTMEAVRNIKRKNRFLLKDINNLIEELKKDYTIQDVI